MYQYPQAIENLVQTANNHGFDRQQLLMLLKRSYVGLMQLWDFDDGIYQDEVVEIVMAFAEKLDRKAWQGEILVTVQKAIQLGEKTNLTFVAPLLGSLRHLLRLVLQGSSRDALDLYTSCHLLMLTETRVYAEVGYEESIPTHEA